MRVPRINHAAFVLPGNDDTSDTIRVIGGCKWYTRMEELELQVPQQPPSLRTRQSYQAYLRSTIQQERFGNG